MYSFVPVGVHEPQRACVTLKRMELSWATSPASVAWLLQGLNRSSVPENREPFCSGIDVTALHVTTVTVPSRRSRSGARSLR